MNRGFVVWLTGLSGAGKSTIAERLGAELAALGRPAELLDGDEVRTNLSKGLGFSKEDRDTNIRRIGFVARLLARNGGVAITAAISPYREIRDEIRAQTPGFFEVFVRCSIDELVRRDVKGLYRKAIAGEIANFTGISDPYEEPLHPEVVVDTERETVEESVAAILAALERRGHIRRGISQRPPSGAERDALLAQARQLPRIDVGARELSDAYMLGTGAMSPLTGFMGQDDYRAVLDWGRLAGGHPFTIPVLLRLDRVTARMAGRAGRVALWHGDEPIATLSVEDVFRDEPGREALAVFGTEDLAHPGVRLLTENERWAVAGAVFGLGKPASPFPEADLTPFEVREMKTRRGWRTMVGFQTRNPVHRAHEYLQKVCLEIVDGLLLHPLVGETKSDDIPAEVRMDCYRALLKGYFPPERVMLATNPAWMRYAGPKEAVFHALIRRNYGCSHFIVGRDHAGVGNFYDTFAAQRIFDQYQPGELGIEILPFDHSFYCRSCDAMATPRTCPHPPESRAALSGTRVRELLAAGEALPREFTRPEVAELLMRAAQAEGAEEVAS